VNIVRRSVFAKTGRAKGRKHIKKERNGRFKKNPRKATTKAPRVLKKEGEGQTRSSWESTEGLFSRGALKEKLRQYKTGEMRKNNRGESRGGRRLCCQCRPRERKGKSEKMVGRNQLWSLKKKRNGERGGGDCEIAKLAEGEVRLFERAMKCFRSRKKKQTFSLYTNTRKPREGAFKAA